MGITGELVRSVFSKSHSIRTHDTYNVKRNNVVEKKRWRRSVRAYLCGDELLFNSVLAEEDTTSVKSSEVTVTQPVLGQSGSTDEGEEVTSDQATWHDSSDQDHSYSLNSKLVTEDAAALVIQAAFRSFMARRLRNSESETVQNDVFTGFESPNRESLATSVEVQTGNSIGVVSIQEECLSVCTKIQQKPKPSLFRQKEDWDDSTINSSLSKLRIQNRLEATTRRERALAYAFSQQLRICSKKKQTISNSTEVNTSWSWLERWMATRQPEGMSVEDRISKQLNELAGTLKTKPTPAKQKFLELSFEGKESCCSNEVPTQADKNGYKSFGNRLKSPRNISRRKTVPTGHYQKEHTKVNKTEGSREVKTDKRQKVKQTESTNVCVSNDTVSRLSSDQSVAVVQNLKSDIESENSRESIYTHVYM